MKANEALVITQSERWILLALPSQLHKSMEYWYFMQTCLVQRNKDVRVRLVHPFIRIETIDYDDYMAFSFCALMRRTRILAPVIIFNPFTSKDCQLSSDVVLQWTIDPLVLNRFCLPVNFHWEALPIFACGFRSLLQFLSDWQFCTEWRRDWVLSNSLYAYNSEAFKCIVCLD